MFGAVRRIEGATCEGQCDGATVQSDGAKVLLERRTFGPSHRTLAPSYHRPVEPFGVYAKGFSSALGPYIDGSFTSCIRRYTLSCPRW